MSPWKVMREAYAQVRLVLPDYASRISRHDYPLAHLYAWLVLRDRMKLSYRDVETLLAEAEGCIRVSMRRVPDHTTLYRAARHSRTGRRVGPAAAGSARSGRGGSGACDGGVPRGRLTCPASRPAGTPDAMKPACRDAAGRGARPKGLWPDPDEALARARPRRDAARGVGRRPGVLGARARCFCGRAASSAVARPSLPGKMHSEWSPQP